MTTVAEALQIGWKRQQGGDVRGAELMYRQVLQVAPRDENAWCFLGMACHDQGRYEEAVDAYRQALRLRANFPVALSNLGNTLKQLGRLDESEASCREALRYQPDYSTAHNNLGVTLVAQGRLVEASHSFERALKLMPNDVVAHANLGAVQVRQGRLDEGTANARRALQINPAYADAHKNQAIVQLLLGDFQHGWAEYEWRWRCPGARLPNLVQPRWNGEPLAGRTLLLHWEQGLGDTIQFVRYARLLRNRYQARIVVCCQKPLRSLLRWCEGIDLLVGDDEPLPAYDSWTPLLSIPGILGTELATIPAECGYLRPDPALVARWQPRLAAIHGFRIGICWQGSSDFHADRQRSIPLRHFAELAQIPGVRLISLQRGLGQRQVDELRGRFEVVTFPDLDTEHGPFLDTAAIVPQLDLVVTADTSIGHLAGALRVPTGLALSVSPDWRWLLDREDSPWYPTARLFRQTRLDDWPGVFACIAREVGKRIERT
ncbi:MAG: tetratricopeptide repeat protein [Pirellulaceae bacterium]